MENVCQRTVISVIYTQKACNTHVIKEESFDSVGVRKSMLKNRY